MMNNLFLNLHFEGRGTSLGFDNLVELFGQEN